MTPGDEMLPARRRDRRRIASPTPAPVARPGRTAVSTVPGSTSGTRSRTRSGSRTGTVRWSRRRGVLGVFAAFAAMGFVVAYVGPTGAAIMQAANAAEGNQVSLYASSVQDAQVREVDADAEPGTAVEFDRGGYEVYVKPKPTPTPVVTAASTGSSSAWRPPFVTPDPGSAQAIAYEMVLARGWGDDEFACLVSLWNKESGWRVNAYNSRSGAYGIPQALPGSKMASAGADWETNPATQIAWGLGYVGGRYGSPCGAWDHSVRTGWY